MLLGIDVGGTFTDAVLIENDKVIKKTKVCTRHEYLLISLLKALDIIIAGIDISNIERITLSTTLITNLIAEKKYDPVALLLTPGPGLNLCHYNYKTDIFVTEGAMNFRGREIIKINPKEIEKIAQKIEHKGYNKLAVIGKFSQRNNIHELAIKEIISHHLSNIEVELGHQVSGQLNYPRRIATTFLTLATKDTYRMFAEAVDDALNERKITAPVYILKADGCTLPLASSLDMPVETIFSGPAASTLGVMAQTPEKQTSVVIDIGGTTTDLALILSGEPLLSTKGVKIEDFLTNVKSFAVRSVPLGGDSTVILENKKIIILPERKGPAYCLGGPLVTPTDALRALDKIEFGDKDKALEAMQMLGTPLEMTEEEVAEQILNLACDIIKEEIEKMFQEWEEEPAYHVWEVLQKQNFRPQNLVGVGGAAGGLIPFVAKKMGCNPIIPEHAAVANAVGAAVAKPTLMVTLRADTEQGYYTIFEEGFQGPLPKEFRFNENDAIELAKDWLERRMREMGITKVAGDIEIVKSEIFNMVRGWTTTGKIYIVIVQNKRGILTYVQGGVCND